MLVSKKELTNLKLQSISVPQLKELATKNNLSATGTATSLIKRLIDISLEELDSFIKEKYLSLVRDRQILISDNDLMRELEKVTGIVWGTVQGQLDQKIQSEYVRKFFRFDALVKHVKGALHDEVTSYVIASWYNHWSTILIEDHISLHPRVIPTLKNNFGIDIFFDNQPFDLKTTYLPRGYDIEDAVKNPNKLAIWLYENQGAQRFGDDNRFFVVLIDTKNPDQSWRLKRNFDLIFKKIDGFFDEEKVSKKDEIIFTFNHKTYTTITKVLIISK